MRLSIQSAAVLVGTLWLGQLNAANLNVHNGGSAYLADGSQVTATQVDIADGGLAFAESALMNSGVTVSGILAVIGIVPTGDFSISATGDVQFTLDGDAVAGIDYYQLQVTGSVTINRNSTLSLTGLGLVSDGTEVVLIQNDSTDSISGTFSGWNEGAFITLPYSGYMARISYQGGDGNDLSLTGYHTFSPIVTSGLWSDAAGTWGSSNLPTRFSFVEIGGGSTVTADVAALAYNVNIGTSSGAGTLLLNNSLDVDNQLFLGLDGEGTLTLGNGSLLTTTNTLFVATEVDSVANINMTGGTWSHSGEAYIADENGIANIDLSGGANWVFAQAESVYFANHEDAQVNLALDGAGTKMTFIEELYLGRAGTVDIDLSNEAALETSEHLFSKQTDNDSPVTINLSSSSSISVSGVDKDFTLQHNSSLAADSSSISVTDSFFVRDGISCTLSNHSTLTADDLDLRDASTFVADASTLNISKLASYGSSVTLQNGSQASLTTLQYYVNQPSSLVLQDSGTSVSISSSMRLARRTNSNSRNSLQILNGATLLHTHTSDPANFSDLSNDVSGADVLISGVDPADQTPASATFLGGIRMGSAEEANTAYATLTVSEGASLAVEQTLLVQNGCEVTFTGSGTNVIIENLTTDATEHGNTLTFSEGASLTVTGDLYIGPLDTIYQTIGAGSSFTATGTVDIDATLIVTLTSGAELKEGDTFTLFSGNTDGLDHRELLLPSLDYGYDWQITETAISLEIEVIQTESDYNIWANSYGLDPTGDGLQLTDFDDDTLVNFTEFAFGLDPTSSDANALVVTDSTTFTPGLPILTWDFSNGTELTVRFVRFKDYSAASLQYAIDTSDDLANWTTVIPTVTQIADDGGEYEVVEATFTVSPDENPNAHFAYVKVIELLE